jgi:hypothetical protein
MTYQSKKTGIWQTTLILPFYDIPITESRYLTNNSNITILWHTNHRKQVSESCLPDTCFLWLVCHRMVILELLVRYLLSLIGMSYNSNIRVVCQKPAFCDWYVIQSQKAGFRQTTIILPFLWHTNQRKQVSGKQL